MKVKELISELMKLDRELEVVCSETMLDIHDMDIIGAEKDEDIEGQVVIEVRRN